MKSLTIFTTLLAISAAKKCVVRNPVDNTKNDLAPVFNEDTPSDDETPVNVDDNTPVEKEDDSAIENSDIEDSENKSKGKLPADFKWGAATAAYQVEGAWNEDGRGESVWDHFTHLYPKNVESGDRSNPDSTNGNVACDSYHKFDEDIKMMKIMNANHYRFSMSWSRLFPDGQAKKVDGKWNVNEKGAEYYDMMINTLIENDI
ncbi:glycoside hydrolase family 1 protein, partial [Piromyces sp. E2]